MPSTSPARRPPTARPPARGRNRRQGLAGLAVVALVGLTTGMIGAPASAEDAPVSTANPEPTSTGPAIGPATPGDVVCTISNSELDEISGMVATANGIYAVEGGTTFQPDSVEIWTINATSCDATMESYGFSPIDPEDLALGTDGALWVADTGRGQYGDREWVTFERVDVAAGDNAVPYRTYFPPTGLINGLAVLLDTTNTPIIIASSGESALLYRPDGPMPADSMQGMPTLQKVGEFRPTNTETSTPDGPFGRLVVTGAAVSPDRTKVVIRTESDAYEFAVPDGDIVKAITQTLPTITPLPDEENGHAITYSADGTRFLTLSSAPDAVLRSYQPYVPQAEVPAGEAPAGGEGGGGGLNFGDITKIAIGTGLLGLAAVVAGIIGIVRFRRQYAQGYPPSRSGSGRSGRGRSGERRRPSDVRARSSGWRDEDGEFQDEGDERSGWAPRPREEELSAWEDEELTARRGSSAQRGTTYGAGGTTYGSSGSTYGSGSGGSTYGSGSGGSTYGSGSSGRSSGSGRASMPGGRGPGGSSGSGGGVYGRPRSEPDDDETRRAYGRDNIDL